MAGVFYIVWILGFAVAAIGYYCLYRDKGATLLRIVAALTWPIAIPIDFVFCDRRWPQRIVAKIKDVDKNRPSRQVRRRQRRQVIVSDYYNNPPKLGGWR